MTEIPANLLVHLLMWRHIYLLCTNDVNNFDLVNSSFTKFTKDGVMKIIKRQTASNVHHGNQEEQLIVLLRSANYTTKPVNLGRSTSRL